MRKIIIKTSILFLVIVSFCGCERIKEVVNMFNCTFERKNIDNFRFAGVGFDRLTSPSDLSLTDLASVGAALLSKTAPITFNVNIEGNNPTTKSAAIEQFKWKLLLDNNEILEGNVIDRFSIPAQGSNILPLEIGFDAWQYLNGNNTESVYNFYQNVTGKNNEQKSNVGIKIKPTINGMEFPQYITVNQRIN